MPHRPKTILVTGIDLVGKTTLGKGITEEMRSQGFNTQFHRGAFSQQPLWEYARSLMSAGYMRDKMRVYAINSALLTAYAFDRLPPHNADGTSASNDGEVIIQDSYAERTVAFCRAHGVRMIPDLLENIRRWKFHFDINIQLYANPEARLERYHMRNDEKKPLEEELLDGSRRAQQMHAEMHRQLAHEQHYLLIDTTNHTPESTLAEAMRFIEERWR